MFQDIRFVLTTELISELQSNYPLQTSKDNFPAM